MKRIKQWFNTWWPTSIELDFSKADFVELEERAD